MKTIKLADWCEKTGVKYLTAWRWFRDDKMPVYAYKTKSGTILVEDDDEEEKLENSIDSSISLFLKKVIEFSNNKSTVEQFASYVLSNFKLSQISFEEKCKHSGNKPDQKEVQEHFKKYYPGNLKKVKKPELPKTINSDNVKKIKEELSAKLFDQNDEKVLKEVLKENSKEGSIINLYHTILNEDIVDNNYDDIEENNSDDIEDVGVLSMNDLNKLLDVIGTEEKDTREVSPYFHRIDESVKGSKVRKTDE